MGSGFMCCPLMTLLRGLWGEMIMKKNVFQYFSCKTTKNVLEVGIIKIDLKK